MTTSVNNLYRTRELVFNARKEIEQLDIKKINNQIHFSSKFDVTWIYDLLNTTIMEIDETLAVMKP